MTDRQFAFRKKVISKLLKLEEKASSPDAVVVEILVWTNAHPILTQKLCRLIDESETFIPEGEEATRVEQLVRSRLIEHWETQSAAEHLKTLHDRLINNQQCDPLVLLQTYKRILQNGEIPTHALSAQAELLNLGLVVQQQGTIEIANRIYESVFDLCWVDQAIANKLQPSPIKRPTPEPSVAIPTLSETPTESVPTLPESLQSHPLSDSHPVENQNGAIDRNGIGLPLPNDLQPLPTTNSVSRSPNASSKLVAEVPAGEDTPTSSATKNPNLFRSLWLLVGAAGLIVIGLNLFRWLQVETIFKQGNERLNQKDYQQAIEDYNTLLKLDSNYYQAWTNRGYGLAGLKEYGKMLESCTTATIIEAKSLYAWNCQGEALHNLKRYEEAIAAFDKAIALDPKDPIFWINKTESLIALKQADPALSAINQAIDLLEQTQATEGKAAVARELSIALSHRGKALSQKQDHAAALSAYERSLTYDPNYFTALRGKGIALQELRRYDDAIAQFQQLVDRSGINSEEKAESAYYLGLTLCESNQSSSAIAAFEKALELKPDYSAAEQARKSCSK